MYIKKKFALLSFIFFFNSLHLLENTEKRVVYFYSLKKITQADETVNRSFKSKFTVKHVAIEYF